jgi:CDP-diacylglycerol--glycerol-3-phosphate 3-phosphatidyltransferase
MLQQASALGVFVFSCLTDWLDGFLARKWKITTNFGAFLDPVADKLMVATSLIMLTLQYPTLLFIIPITLIICREISISALREWMAGRKLRNIIQVGLMGKIKTTLQMIATSLLLLVCPSSSLDVDLCQLWSLPKHSIFLAGMLALYASTVATMWSGWEYFHAAWPELHGANE